MMMRSAAGPEAMYSRLFTIAAALGVLFGASQAAGAAPGFAKSSVNLRSGPGTSYSRIATIPAGAPVNVLRCRGWCEVVYAGRRGWASSSYIARGGAPRGAYVLLPDQSLCHGPGAWSIPYCEWPIERSVREFNQSTWEYNNRRGGAPRKR